MNPDSFCLSGKWGIVNRKFIPFSIRFPIHLVTIPVPIPENLPNMAKEPELWFRLDTAVAKTDFRAPRARGMRGEGGSEGGDHACFQSDLVRKGRENGKQERQGASVVMQRLYYLTETVLFNKIARNRIVPSFKDSPSKPLGRWPKDGWMKHCFRLQIFLTDPDGMPFLLNRLSKFFQLDISSLIIYWLYSSLIRVTNEYFPVLEEKFRQSSEYFSCSRSILPLPTERLHRM